MQRRPFWPLLVVACVLLALAGATLSAAAFSDPAGTAGVHTFGYPVLFGRPLSLTWSSDGALIGAAAALCAGGVGMWLLAARRRRV